MKASGAMAKRVRVRDWSEAKKSLLSAEDLAEAERAAEEEVLEMNLMELRKLAGKTQAELAAATKFKQSELSRAERRKDHLLSTLRRYIEGLGGELEIIARVNGKTVKLRGV